MILFSPIIAPLPLPVIPAPPQPPSPLPAGNPTARSISPRKVILGIILAGSIVFFFLILFAGIFAIVREAAPRSSAGQVSAVAILRVVKHLIAHHIPIPHHK